jgi:predicted TIM-barrel fold metal-dependent hydrolase
VLRRRRDDGARGGAPREPRLVRTLATVRHSASMRSARVPSWLHRLRVVAAALAVLTAIGAGAARGADRLPIFDAHLHYNDEATATLPVAAVLRTFADSGVRWILATSRPNDGTRALAAAAASEPGAAPRVVPFIRPYRTEADRATWFNDPAIYALIEAELARPVAWRGIGEFHLFGRDANTTWVRRIVSLAVERGLWLHAHCDEPALEALFAHDRHARIVWAHTGFTTPPERIARYLERYPNLVGELSYRSDLTSGGRLTPQWRALLERFPDRFVVGSDTWVNARWAQYGEIIDSYRRWLAELTPAAAAMVAHGNGERLFAPQ